MFRSRQPQKIKTYWETTQILLSICIWMIVCSLIVPIAILALIFLPGMTDNQSPMSKKLFWIRSRQDRLSN